MKLAASIGYPFESHSAAQRAMDLEAAGIDMIFVPEVYAFDAVSLIGYLAAHTQRVELATGVIPLFSRTPTMIAMTAAGLDSVTDGRFVLGLGTSGPQVIEGWHGVPFDRPLTRTREAVEICRMVWRRDRLEYDGEAYRLPLPADEGTGLGKPLKLINHPVRREIPIYIASIGPKNLQLTAEIADGWLPAFFHPDKASEVFGRDLAIGEQRRNPNRGPLEVVAGGPLAICNAETAARIRDRARPTIALYVGGMGARDKNFYNLVFRRCGYERAAQQIQDLYLSGKKDEAAAAVPADYLEETALVGDEGHVRDRVQAYKAAGVTRLLVDPIGDDPLGLVERVKAWVA
jgi:F420-dependent oxidoreductase-like protein